MLKAFASYRGLLALPGARTVFVVGLLARLPFTAASMALALHVVIDLDRGYGAAGLADLMLTVGGAVGAPLLGRSLDRFGVRPVVLVTGAVDAVFWIGAPYLSYPWLLAASVVAGFMGLPVFTAIRRAIATNIPSEHQRQAFALDAILVEVVFMVGPAVAVGAITAVNDATATMTGIGVLYLGAGLLLTRLAPAPAAGGAAAGPKDPEATEPGGRSLWLRPGFLLVLGVSLAANLVLAGSEISITAVLRGVGDTEWAGVCVAIWCAASMFGGFWHGATSRPWRLPRLMLLMGLTIAPVGIAGHAGWIWLAVAMLPSGFMCAPTLASASEEITRAVPPSVVGQAAGLQGSAMTIGGAIGAPLAGAVIDHSAPAWGFAVTGLVGASLAAATIAYQYFARPKPAEPSTDQADTPATV
ncbi:MFS transporter [Kitasatospora xanthocidica]|uniref:MFS transporter n=1 Tax=Kitasatospora xanthocidica TaxID=83382 RepID=UPI001671CC8E|nr:MFS transporter [Kitasatospora xanthocidica]GHF38118.1 MFS transporter [Kitasatospora xanthocidica]